MVGMLLGMLLARITMGNYLAIWISFLLLTLFHMYANYKAVKCLSLRTLNAERCTILLQQFITTRQALSPQEVSHMEHVLPSWTSFQFSKQKKKIRLGAKVSSLTHPEMKNLLNLTDPHLRKNKYILLKNQGCVNIIIHNSGTPADILQSYIHALVLSNSEGKTTSSHVESRIWMDQNYPEFIRKLQSLGWNTERMLSSSIVWRANWSFSPAVEKSS